MPATRLDALIAGRENCIAIEIHKKTLCDAILQADMRALLFDRSRRRKIRAAVPADFTVTKVTPGCHRPRYYGGHDPFMAKLPGGGGSGRYDRARNADRSPGHVMVVRISRSALAPWN